MSNDNIRIVEKKTCIVLHRGKEVIATLAGPDAVENAEKIAAALTQQPESEPVARFKFAHHGRGPDAVVALEYKNGKQIHPMPPAGAKLYLSPQPSAQVPKVTKGPDNDDFLSGVLVALQVLHGYDSAVEAKEIVGAVGLDDLVALAIKEGGVDMETMDWVKQWMRTGLQRPKPPEAQS